MAEIILALGRRGVKDNHMTNPAIGSEMALRGRLPNNAVQPTRACGPRG